MTAGAMTTDPRELVARLAKLLAVQEHSPDHFVGGRKIGGEGRVFGGEIIAQALMAAAGTIAPDRVVHSLHAYFIRGGSENHPTEYNVARDFDGRTFSTRRVTAIQLGEVILNFAASFQRPEQGLEHQDPMPDAPPPESLKSETELRQAYLHLIPEHLHKRLMTLGAVEYRPVNPQLDMGSTPRPAAHQTWVRLASPGPKDPLLHRAMLAYASDMHLLGTCSLPHGLSWMRNEIVSASLDHAVWFHEDVDMNDWLLYTMTSPWSKGSRGLNHGTFHNRDGRLIASVAQEGLIRKRRDD